MLGANIRVPNYCLSLFRFLNDAKQLMTEFKHFKVLELIPCDASNFMSLRIQNQTTYAIKLGFHFQRIIIYTERESGQRI
jgi:hypothetical protein